MSSQTSQTQDNALIPIAFLIGITVLLVFMAVPRPYRDAPAKTPVPTQAATVVAAVSNSAAQPTPEDHLILMSLGLEEVSSSSVATGRRLYTTACSACHGANAQGIAGLGKTLIGSPFVDQMNDTQLVEFLHVGRTISDPANTTGVAMPAKGGNPSLTDDDLNAIVDYIRSLNGATIVDDGGADATPVPTARPFQALDLNSVSGSSPNTAPEGGLPTETGEQPAATPTTGYGFETQGEVAATPTTSYGFETQGEATPEPTAISGESAPITDYPYETQNGGLNTPPTYSYETQVDAPAEATAQP